MLPTRWPKCLCSSAQLTISPGFSFIFYSGTFIMLDDLMMISIFKANKGRSFFNNFAMLLCCLCIQTRDNRASSGILG